MQTLIDAEVPMYSKWRRVKMNQEEQAKSTQGTRTDLESSPNGEQSKLKTHTDKELSKMAGIGTGSVARFNKLMNSDDEEFKKKIRNKQKKICP